MPTYTNLHINGTNTSSSIRMNWPSIQDLNVMCNIHIVDELIQLIAEIIANLHWTEDLTTDITLENS